MQTQISNWADSELVCNCNGVTKGGIVKAIRERGFTSREQVASFTRAGTGCGSCAALVEDLVNLHAPQRAVKPAGGSPKAAPAAERREPRHYPRNLEIPRIKKEGLALDFARICRQGVSALSDDDYYRLKTYGVCSQKHPEYFMMRIRIPGGRVNADQLECLGELARCYGRGWGHLTTRQGMELHWVKLENLPDIWARLEAVGLTSRSACGHTLRNVMACPHSAISPTSVADVRPWAKAISDYFVSRSAILNPAMPNRLNIYFAGCDECAAHAPVNDIGLVAVNRPSAEAGSSSFGFELWVGGSLGSYPVLGYRLKGYLLPEEVLPACQAVFQIYLRHGGGQKGKTRLKSLIEELSREKFEELFDKEFSSTSELPENRLFPLKFPAWPSASSGTEQKDNSAKSAPRSWISLPIFRPKPLPAGWSAVWPAAWKDQRQSGYAWCVLEMPLGEIRPKQLAALGRLLRRHRKMEVSFNMDQNVELHWVRRKEIGFVQAVLQDAGFTLKGAEDGPRLVACAGTQFCVLAVTNSQGAARDLQKQIEPRTRAEGDLLRGLTINISGCPNSCAKHQISDIGLAGGMTSLGDHRRYAYQLYIGGGVEGTAQLGSVIRKGVSEEMVVPVVQALTQIAAQEKRETESFRDWVNRVGPGEVGRLLDEKLAGQGPQKSDRIRMAAEVTEVLGL